MPSCCGRARPLASMPATSAPAPVAHAPAPAPVPFVYTGDRVLSARGAITGRAYRFNRPGDVVHVDARDAASLSAVPSLRRVAR